MKYTAYHIFYVLLYNIYKTCDTWYNIYGTWYVIGDVYSTIYIIKYITCKIK